MEKETLLTSVLLESKAAKKAKDTARWKTTLEVRFVVDANGSVNIDVQEVGGASVTSQIPAL